MNATHVYVHVPFCARRCTYCDFSIAVRRRVPADEYLRALGREIERAGRPAAPETLYLGGGTPSLLGGAGIAEIASLLGVGREVVEFTVEANPDDVTAEAARAWAAADVTRLSIGAQSFDDRVLAWMHRTHDSGAIGRAVGTARAAGIRNLSLDLIFALPESLGRDFARDLAAAIACEPDHISLYGLTIEPGTALARQVERGACSAAPEGRYEEDYLQAHGTLETAGYRFYEVSNAARPGKEAVHNRAYWRLAPYMGFGPSAHSFDGTSRWWNEAAYARWRELLEQGQSPVAGREILSAPQRRLEQLYLGLRTSEGIEVTEALAEQIGRWVASGWAAWLSAGEAGAVGRGRAPCVPSDRPSPTAPADPARGDVPSDRPSPTAPADPARGDVPSDRPSPTVPADPAPRRVRLTPQGWLRLDALVASI
ncbi:MAG: radical SAM family heme chaperone HemW [Gemmatimonadetes bacterium]|nr:radical SAM family heme chaperone HemW [Gemmatimonadota bacterium]